MKIDLTALTQDELAALVSVVTPPEVIRYIDEYDGEDSYNYEEGDMVQQGHLFWFFDGERFNPATDAQVEVHKIAEEEKAEKQRQIIAYHQSPEYAVILAQQKVADELAHAERVKNGTDLASVILKMDSIPLLSMIPKGPDVPGFEWQFDVYDPK